MYNVQTLPSTIPSQARLCRNIQHSFLIPPFAHILFLFSKPLLFLLLPSTTYISFKFLSLAFSENSAFLECYLFKILTAARVCSVALNLTLFCVVHELFHEHPFLFTPIRTILCKHLSQGSNIPLGTDNSL